MGVFDGLRWTNDFTRLLPADPDPSNHRREVRNAAYSRVAPTPTRAPSLLAWVPEVASQLGLPEDPLSADDPTVASALAAVLGGSVVPEGADPFAMAYAGHQFGTWAGQLGDGRAIALGEVVDVEERSQMLQLKGAGPTPYSRGADGRAVLRSSVRELLCSEAMHHLGIATTRALSLVLTGESVVRDMLYDGNPEAEPGAVVCRVAASFTRFGSFQLPASRGEVELLRALVEHTIRSDFPGVWRRHAEDAVPFEDIVVEWFREIVTRHAILVVGWMRVGFVHGVLNTDNMSTLGLTIDYGPYGWLEGYDPSWTPNTTDASTRRYRYGAQPAVIGWNLAQLATALLALVGSTDGLQQALDTYAELYAEMFAAMSAERLGWAEWRDGDAALIERLLALLTRTETDYVLFHRNLAHVPVHPDASDDDLLAPMLSAYYAANDLEGELRAETVAWLRAWGQRVRHGGLGDDERIARMHAQNPRFVLRNWMAQEAIDAAARGDASVIDELLDVLRKPYDDQPGNDRWARRRPDWARDRVGCSMLSCSS